MFSFFWRLAPDSSHHIFQRSTYQIPLVCSSKPPESHLVPYHCSRANSALVFTSFLLVQPKITSPYVTPLCLSFFPATIDAPLAFRSMGHCWPIGIRSEQNNGSLFYLQRKSSDFHVMTFIRSPFRLHAWPTQNTFWGQASLFLLHALLSHSCFQQSHSQICDCHTSFCHKLRHLMSWKVLRSAI